MSKHITKTINMTLCALFTALIAVGAFIRIPVPYMPITLQTFFVLLSGMFLGARWGAVSAGLYMVLGLVGLPVFTEGGGLWYVLKPGFGYIMGFVIGAFVTGKILKSMKSNTLKNRFLAGIAGLAVIYLIGVLYACMISHFYLGITLSVRTIVIFYFLLLIPGDMVLCFLSAYISGKLIPVLSDKRKIVRP